MTSLQFLGVLSFKSSDLKRTLLLYYAALPASSQARENDDSSLSTSSARRIGIRDPDLALADAVRNSRRHSHITNLSYCHTYTIVDTAYTGPPVGTYYTLQ